MKRLIVAALMLSSVFCYAQNPIISAVYTPDPAPYVHDGKVYLFVDHDEDDATYFKMKDWLLFSSEDMVNWTYLGAQVSTETFSWAAQGDRAWASQAVERGGRWYWYLCCNTSDGKDALAVAVADNPQGPWKDAIGAPLATGWGFIDPTVFIDNDGTPYLFWGNKGLWYGKLNDDMVSFADGYKEVPGYHDPASFGELQMKMNWQIGKDEAMTQYEEGPWVSRRGELYYIVYPAGGVPEYMAYSTSPTIDGPWTFRGRIMDEAVNSFTIHGGNISFKGHDYMFYHNGILPNGWGFHRSSAVEEFTFNPDGTIPFIPFTTKGVDPVGTVNPYKRVEAETMSSSWGVKLDRLPGRLHYVTSVHNGDWVKVREVDFAEEGPVSLSTGILNCKNPGKVEFYLDEISGRPVASVEVDGGNVVKTVPVRAGVKGKHDVYVLFRGGDEELFDLDWWQCLKQDAVLPGNSADIVVNSSRITGTVDEMLYGQLFEHIYFSANNGVWNEMIFERSFEPEHFPGITPRDGYFDGWFADDEGVLHSPTRYEQPIRLTSVDTDDYEITMDVNWRSYRLARRSWSGGLLDIRFACKNKADGEPYFVRIHNPYYEARILNVGQTEAMIAAARDAEARAAAQKQLTEPNFSISVLTEKEMPSFGGRTRRVKTFDPITYKIADAGQINENQDWHKLRISCKGGEMKVYWDGRRVLSASKLESVGVNDIVFWENYTETTYKNIRVTSLDGRKVYFEGLPEDVKIPAVAPQWTAFGDGVYEMVKGDAVNMDYSQKISSDGPAGVLQGPQAIKPGEHYIGSVYAKGDGKLSVGLGSPDNFVARQTLGVPGPEWKEFKFDLDPSGYTGDADFAICVEGGTVLVDQVTMSSSSGLASGGFRPDILQTVKNLHPTCLRWPGGGYAAQYDWRWGVGPQKDRRRWDHWQWMDYDQNCFGTDEFIKFCREIDAEPIIVVSVHFEKPESEHAAIVEEACQWLRYCNEPATGEWGARRAANGHSEPYNVKYWEIDNEMWEMGIDRYEAYVRDMSTAFREIDPSVKIIVCGGFQEDEEFINRSGHLFDYMSLHHYEQQNGYETGPERLAAQYDRYAKMISAGPNPNIKLFISEWNLQTIDWRTGLFAGGFLNVCEQRDVVALGAAALFIRRTDMPDWNNAFINFDYKDVFVAPNYQVTKLWYDNFSKYLISYTGATGRLNVVSTLSEDGGEVILKIVNPTGEETTLAVGGDWKGRSSASYEYYAPGSLTACNSMEDKDAVSLQRKSVDYSGDELIVNVPAYSAGVVRIPKYSK
ncbi:MAG: family 43 glycosylhydrolase [Bacteroidales bacterium]|nr:family 43 glycosylhydrolase [Bacteroidales bacterium]